MVKIFSHYVSKLVSALLLLELFVLIASMYGAQAFMFSQGWTPFPKPDAFFSSASGFALAMALSMAALGLYHIEGSPAPSAIAAKLLPASVLGFGISALLLSISPQLYVAPQVVGLAALASAGAILGIRLLVFRTFSLPILESRVIFLGEGALARECSRLAASAAFPKKYHIVGFVQLRTEECQVASSSLLPANESLVSIARKYNVREIIVSTQNQRGSSFPLHQLLECKLHGIKVTGAAAFFEREARQIRVDSLYPSWLIFGDGFNQSSWRTICKRAFDLVVSLLIFAMALPVMLATSLCIFFEDRGPIIYRQERVGKDGHTFHVLKFRSMCIDAERAGAPQWAAANDDRVTRVGRIIRKLRIDELPQVINVLRGEMSFVGPRPERPFFVKQLCEKIPYYDMRHSIKPGITGFAQVRYQYGASVEDTVQKLQYDLYYVKNHSLFLDLLILVETLQVVLFAKGSR
ncbi:TIGR03013 family XrtA/PEP-CTERM system glycosyltransferase [Noviherbaspirillum massiliense]|uniref:TIGR03013 family XrtA/PEP-CTERM system glycosyltransferase n=1 Tax=Noviherbaspirillum massiliense TaxID=1465823 RepID=UPI0002EDDDCA|nr:TIGR03013 family XrtA/PEP-CTERM system glycosyltransferase [Noviherbaspirillum massiliense]